MLSTHAADAQVPRRDEIPVSKNRYKTRQIPEWASLNLSSDWMWSPNGENKLQIAVTVHETKINHRAGSELSRLLSQKQVRPDDQSGYPKDTIESFVGHSSMGLLCPPAG